VPNILSKPTNTGRATLEASNQRLLEQEKTILQKKPSESPRFQSWDERLRCPASPFGDGKSNQFTG
jgi:hypothetical protein